MRHDVVTEALFVFRCPLEIDVVDRGTHLAERFIGDTESELTLGLRQGHPETSPDAEAMEGGKDRLHLAGGVAFREGMHVEAVPVIHPRTNSGVARR